MERGEWREKEGYRNRGDKGGGGGVFFFKQKTAYEIVSRDWSSDVCSSDLKCLKTFYWDNDGVNGVAISSDGKILAAGGWNGIIKIWNIQTGECIKTLSNKPYANMNITNATGLTPEQKSSLKALGAIEQ